MEYSHQITAKSFRPYSSVRLFPGANSKIVGNDSEMFNKVSWLISQKDDYKFKSADLDVLHSTKLKRGFLKGHLWPCDAFLNHEMWGKIANVITYSKGLKNLTWVRNYTLSLVSVLGKIMEKLIRDLNDRDSKDRNIINVNQHSFSEKYSLCGKLDFE